MQHYTLVLTYSVHVWIFIFLSTDYYPLIYPLQRIYIYIYIKIHLFLDLSHFYLSFHSVFGQFVIKFRKSSNLKLFNTSGSILVPCTELVSCICEFWIVVYWYIILLLSFEGGLFYTCRNISICWIYVLMHIYWYIILETNKPNFVTGVAGTSLFIFLLKFLVVIHILVVLLIYNFQIFCLFALNQKFDFYIFIF